MLDYQTAHELFAIAEHNNLRAEAMELYERCLTEGKAIFLEEFVHQQILSNPPRFNLLLHIAGDVQQQIITLSQSLLEIRTGLVSHVLKKYQIDLNHVEPVISTGDSTQFCPADMLDYLRQNLSLDSVDFSSLELLFQTAHLTVEQLNDDIIMSQYLLELIVDWVDSLSIDSFRHNWPSTWEPKSNPAIH
ncbi:MAG: hypothetical protein R3E39_02365 [Anaerolineae bacterium]